MDKIHVSVLSPSVSPLDRCGRKVDGVEVLVELLPVWALSVFWHMIHPFHTQQLVVKQGELSHLFV